MLSTVFGYAHGNKNIVTLANNSKTTYFYVLFSQIKEKLFMNIYFSNVINTIFNT